MTPIIILQRRLFRIARLFAVLVLIVLPSTFEVSAGDKPIAKNKASVALAVHNATEIVPLATHARRANKLHRGPGPHELTLLRWGEGVDVVDDREFKTIRTLIDKEKVVDYTFSAKSGLQAWNLQGDDRYFVRDSATMETYEVDIGESPGFARFSPDGKKLVVGKTTWHPQIEGAGKSCCLMFDHDGNLLKTLGETGPGAITPVFSPNGKMLAIGNRNRDTLIYDVESGKQRHQFIKAMTHEIAFSPDGTSLACAYVDGSVVVWDIESGEKRYTLHSGCEEVYSLDWSPAGDLLATGGLRGNIAVWKTEEPELLIELPTGLWTGQVRFSEDGDRLLGYSSGDHGEKTERKITVYGLKAAE